MTSGISRKYKYFVIHSPIYLLAPGLFKSQQQVEKSRGKPQGVGGRTPTLTPDIPYPSTQGYSVTGVEGYINKRYQIIHFEPLRVQLCCFHNKLQ